MAKIDQKGSKMPKNPIMTHFGHVSGGGSIWHPQDLDFGPRSTQIRMSRPWSGAKPRFLTKNDKKWENPKWGSFTTLGLAGRRPKSILGCQKCQGGSKIRPTRGWYMSKTGHGPCFFTKNHFFEGSDHDFRGGQSGQNRLPDWATEIAGLSHVSKKVK